MIESKLLQRPIRLSRLFAFAALCFGQASALPAFPGAEGWGADTKGGRGGKVYIVTTLATSGPGSLNEALQAKGPRIIVFRVSGVIDMKASNAWYLAEENAFVTLAGQTSPGGITLVSSTGGSATIFSYHGNFHDGIFRFMRFRANAGNDDGLTLNGANHFILDHCDVSGGADETLDITASNDYTVQWSTVTNSSKGQSYGFLMAYLPTSHVTLHHNLFANHVFRFPEMHWEEGAPPDKGKIDYRNNVCHNGERYYLYSFEEIPPLSVELNMVGNYHKAGPQTPADWFPKMVSLGAKITAYAKDNVMATRAGVENSTDVTARIPNPVASPFATPAVTTHTAKEAYALVLDKGGAWPRDAMNVRTVGEVRSGGGQMTKDDDPFISGGPEAPADKDNDGMGDEWETAMGLNPGSAADNVLDQDGDGYTNIEEYINDIALALLREPLLNPKGAGGIHVGVGAKKGGARKMKVSQDPRRGSLQIQLPAGAPRMGTVEISDLWGRTLAAFPAEGKISWDYARGGKGNPAGMYTVRWIAWGRTVESAKVEIL